MLRTGRVSDPDALITLLEEFAAEPRKVAELTDEQRRRLMIAAGQLSRPDRYTRKALRKGLNRKAELATKAADRAILDGTGIRALRKLPIFTSLGAIPALPPGEQIDDPDRIARAIFDVVLDTRGKAGGGVGSGHGQSLRDSTSRGFLGMNENTRS